MVFFNHATRQMTAKIVYYGPGLCGKTTNLNTIYGKTSQKARGEMVSLNTETDRTLFFDLLPLDVGVIGGFKAKLQLYTVPGQVFYNSTRKLVLKGVDGIVFVADSQIPMLDANKESLQNLDDNLRELGLDIRQIPTIFQWNKRDLKNVVSVEQLEAELNPRKQPSCQSVASDGMGVFETLRGITKLALANIKAHHFADTGAEIEPPPAVAAVPEPPVPAKAPHALTLSDLPSVGELLDEESSSPRPIPAPPKVPLPAATMARVSPPLRSAPAPVKPMAMHVPSMGALQPAKVNVPFKPVAPRMVSLAPAAAIKPIAKAMPAPAAPRTAMASLMGDAFSAGMAASAPLKLDLPAALGNGELEIIVQVRQGVNIVAEGTIRKHSPAEGSTARLSIELKRG